MAVVFINPGHSLINDAGATNKELGLEERHLALSLGAELQKDLEMIGIFTELYQEQRSLNEVPVRANKSGADVFVSIHMNGSTSKTASGVEVLYCEGSDKGKDFATHILNNIVTVGSYTFKNRGVKNDASRHLCVLRNTNMTAVLVEMGFITNNKEATFVSTHIQQCSKAISKGIVSYLESQKLLKPAQEVTVEPKEDDTKHELIIIPSGKNDKYDLKVDDKIVLKENNIETIHQYILLRYKASVY